MSLDTYGTIFAKPWFRTRTSTPIGAITPAHGGDLPEFVFDTTNNAMYFATGATNTDWVQLAAASSGAEIAQTVTESVTDDSVGTITAAVAASSGRIAIISSSGASSYGIVHFRGSDGRVDLLTSEAGFDVLTSTVLTGTTGVDGNTTISYEETTDTLYIENREGLTQIYRVTIL